MFSTILFPFFNARFQHSFALPKFWIGLNCQFFLLCGLAANFGNFLHKICGFFSINEKKFFQNFKMFNFFNVSSNSAGCFHFGRSSFVSSSLRRFFSCSQLVVHLELFLSHFNMCFHQFLAIFFLWLLNFTSSIFLQLLTFSSSWIL